MTFDEAKNHLVGAAKAGKLMTPKHDPANLSTVYSAYRSVMSAELAANLETFLESLNYTIIEYENKNFPTSPFYLEIQPNAASPYTIPASGVAPASPVASTALDRLVAVSGQNQGWHIFGEDSASIQRKLANGDLDLKGKL